MAAVVNLAECTAKWSADGIATACKTAGACCTTFAATTASTTATGTKTICIPPDTLASKSLTIDST